MAAKAIDGGDAISGVDAITFEIIRHRLWAINDEMAQTLIRTAANPTITEANDFMVALYNEKGEIALGGWGGNRHLSCIAVACRAILDRFSLADIHEDDVFLLNDPYVAAVHQQDVYLISPIHLGGELVGWSGNFTHLADVGGMNPGNSPTATDIRQEGLRIPGLKISDRGVVRQDVLDSLLTMTREPEMNALQLRAQMAANHTGKAKLRELVQSIGPNQFRAVMARMMEQSERGLRARLLRIPDGTWRARHYLDGDGGRLYTINLAMTKDGDHLEFDFTGTSPQAPNSINSTFWSTRGGVFVAVSSLLGHELIWNEGLLKPISVICPVGTLLNCAFPGAVSSSAYRVSEHAALNTMSGMLAMSGEFANDITAMWSCGSSSHRITGMNREGRSFLLTPMASSGGTGARRFADGVDGGGSLANPTMSSANTETLERNAPIRYLFRRYGEDSGGPGFHRGGASTDTAFALHKAPEGKLTLVIRVYGHDPAMSLGLFGGLPGPQVYTEIRSGLDIDEVLSGDAPLELESMGGEAFPSPAGVVQLFEDGLYYSSQGGGGGIGDPLLRPPEKVAADVLSGLVSAEQARQSYGVVMDETGTATDEEATRLLRGELRARRLGVADTDWRTPSAPEDVTRPVTYDTSKGLAFCAACGYELAPLTDNWKLRVIQHSEPLGDLGTPWLPSSFELRTYGCPGCGALLDSEEALPDDAPLLNYSPLPSPVESSSARG